MDNAGNASPNWQSARAAWGRRRTCRLQLFTVWQVMGFPGESVGEESAYSAGDSGLGPGCFLEEGGAVPSSILV